MSTDTQVSGSRLLPARVQAKHGGQALAGGGPGDGRDGLRGPLRDQPAPVLSAFFLFFALASLGLPGLNNFVGEILILLGAFRANPLWGALAMGGVVFAAAYMLRLVQGVIWGPSEGRTEEITWTDLHPRELLILAPLAVLVLWIGLYPETFLAPIREPVRNLLEGATLVAMKGGLP